MNDIEDEMRLPEEGTPTGAGPGTGVNASGQRPGNSRQPGRGHPESQSMIQRSRTTTGTPPAESAAHDSDVLTQAGLPRRRLKWTREMNISVLRAYYMATRNEDFTNYRQRMYDIFIQQHPHLGQLTQQNLADRRATIFRDNLIPSTLREEIRLRINNQQPQEPAHTIQDQPSTPTLPEVLNPIVFNNDEIAQRQEEREQQLLNGTTHATTQTTSRLEDISSIRTTFNAAKIKFMEMQAQYRPILPKYKPNKRMYQVTLTINKEILPAELTSQSDYNHIVGLAYCSAYTIIQTIKPKTNDQYDEENNQRTLQQTASRKHQEIKPGWHRRLQAKIDDLRKDLGYLTAYSTNKTGRKTKAKLLNIRRRHQVHTQYDPPNLTIEQLRDTVRQKLQKYTDRMRNYTRSYERAKHNRIFQTEEKRFYNMVTEHSDPTTRVNNVNIGDVEKFWKDVWSKPITHNKTPIWMNSLRESTINNTPMTATVITDDIFKMVIGKLHNWKHPGIDKIHNYYYKYLTSLHSPMIRIFNDFIANPEHISPEMCKGVTYLKPKVINPTSPSQFRPITCLNTGYKILTSCIAMAIRNYCEGNKALAEEQKGCRQGTKGCKDLLVIDSIVTKQAIRNKRNMYTTFIDYQKAFDSVPHSWLLDVLEIYKIDASLRNCIKWLMGYWETTLHLRSGNNNIISEPIKIQRGIYQGDSLSPLMFCIALNPLSLLLRQSQYGYKLDDDTGKITHCFYMDDLKLYASTKPHRDNLLKIVEMFSSDIGMKFGIDKCRTQNVTRGKYAVAENFTTSDNEQITPLLREEHYKYLGIMQHIAIDHKKQKESIGKEFNNRINKICKTKLNGRNLVKAINTYAIPLLTYTFGIIAWSETDLNNLDMKVRTILTRNKYHHPKASVERTNIPRKFGGRGIINIKLLHDRQLEKLVKYFRTKATVSQFYRGIVNADDNITPLNLKNHTNDQPKTIGGLIEDWKSKPLHGRYPSMLTQSYVDTATTNNWLIYSNIFAETEGFIIAIQDGVIPTRNYRKYIIRDPTVTNDSCRRCGDTPETIPHLLNSCTTLLQSHYKQRHDNVGKIVHKNVIEQLKINEPTTYYYRYNPKPMIEDDHYIIYWDRSILVNNPTNANIPNRPDMVIIDKARKMAQIIDFAVPYDNNLQETIATKRSKYVQLAQYIKNTRNLVQVDILPIVISSIGTIPLQTVCAIKSLNLSVKIITEMQKSVLIKATTIMRETLQW